ncbi:MAG: hypothetical protein KJI72_01290 [Patescibacteria group bacterium]|nr:hypothetical protein [Patescibacteria group bacterium]
MVVIPAINCPDFLCVKKRIRQVGELGSSWVHIDVADGEFTPYKTWSNPDELSKAVHQSQRINIGIHLMVEGPEEVVGDWLKSGAKRVIMHIKALRSDAPTFAKLVEKWKTRFSQAEIGLAIAPNTGTEELFPYLNSISFVQTLAVNPGRAGQEFNPIVLDKVRLLKEKFPNVTVEVDGGINIETAKLVKDAGADIIASASYIWGGADPKAAFDGLQGI